MFSESVDSGMQLGRALGGAVFFVLSFALLWEAIRRIISALPKIENIYVLAVFALIFILEYFLNYFLILTPKLSAGLFLSSLVIWIFSFAFKLFKRIKNKSTH